MIEWMKRENGPRQEDSRSRLDPCKKSWTKINEAPTGQILEMRPWTGKEGQ